MKNVLFVALRIVIGCLLSSWILLLWFGIDSWQTGIQQQIDGTREANSFPYEGIGKSCIRWASIWGFVSCTGIAFWSLQKRNSKA